MRAAALAAALLVPVLAPSAHAADLVEVPLRAPALELPALARLADVTEDVTARRARVVADGRTVARLREHGFPVRVVVRDLEAHARAARRTDAARAARRSGLPSGRSTYRSLADYTADERALVARHPGLVRPVALPRRSVEGRPITGVELAADVGRDDDGRPVFVVMGLHHAREWPSGEIAMELAIDLARRFGHDPRVTSLLRREWVVVLPVVNPDGFVESRGAEPLRRRNCEPLTPAEAILSCTGRRGVDLNRNYGAFWGGDAAGVSPDSDTYRGPAPWSEPESAGVHALTQRLQVTGLQTLHNVGGQVLREPGFRALGRPPDAGRLKALGDAMAAAAGYRSEPGDALYDATGATEDSNYAAQGTFGYTIEVGPAGGTFQGPYRTHVIDQYLGTRAAGTARRGLRAALLLAGEEAADPADHAIVAGRAPAGRTLRLRRDFTTATSPVCQTDALDASGACAVTAPAFGIADFVDTTLTVPAAGRFTWHVGPSTRPFERRAGRVEAWTLTCEDGGRVLDRMAVVVGRGQTATVSLPCGGPGSVTGPAVARTPADPASAALEAVLARRRVAAPSSRVGRGRGRAGTLRVTSRVALP